METLEIILAVGKFGNGCFTSDNGGEMMIPNIEMIVNFYWNHVLFQMGI